jgi:Mce-associated membrane protein
VSPQASSTSDQLEEQHVTTTELASEDTSLADQDEPGPPGSSPPARSDRWTRVVGFAVLPAVIVALAGATGYTKWQVGTARDAVAAQAESVQGARDAAVALLSYAPDTVEQQLSAASALLTGSFKDSYAKLTHDVVIPGAQQKHISATASVPAAASVSASATHAMVLVFVDQTVVIGDGAPTITSSVVQVSMDDVNGRWLVSAFDPI